MMDYGTFLENLRPVFTRHAYRYLAEIWSARLEADDLVQEAMLMLWQKRDLVIQSADMIPYAVAAAKNAMVMYIRREVNPARLISIEGDYHQIPNMVHDCPRNDDVRRLVLNITRCLCARQRLALFLIYRIDDESGPVHRRDFASGDDMLYRTKYNALQNLKRSLSAAQVERQVQA